MNNLEIYNALRSVPENAKSPITAGRLKGKTDINPMWRIKALTDRFGPCGEGWGYTIDRLWTEEGANGERTANAQIGLWYRLPDGRKSEPVPGIGGNMLVAKEKNGLYTSDECYKMALTDAISVSAKALGVGADVYWDADQTKYNPTPPPEQEQQQPPKKAPVCTDCKKAIVGIIYQGKSKPPEEIAEMAKSNFGRPLCYDCFVKEWRKKERSLDAAVTEYRHEDAGDRL